ncbi:hypothetical protein Gogos_005965 [Gossypium gossypioides]|uniref:Uncharacterized protein n=1 Tax=Gossypium gossypioides TaxID=34282 RepID=A0A7J9C458_GOSGO|nr:hypothetical protein [Gossypium gossypioides]
MIGAKQSKAKRSRKKKKPEKRGKGNGATGNYRNGVFGMNHSKAFYRFSHKLKFFPRPPIPVISRGLSLSLTSSLLCLYMEMEEKVDANIAKEIKKGIIGVMMLNG